MADETVTVTLTLAEGLELGKAAETGLRVIEALGLLPQTGQMRAAIAKLNGVVQVAQKGAPEGRRRPSVERQEKEVDVIRAAFLPKKPRSRGPSR